MLPDMSCLWRVGRPRPTGRARRPSLHRTMLQAARPTGTGWAQCAQRLASIGISLRHSGHFLVVTGGVGSSLCMRARRALTGVTTKKYTAAATSRKEMVWLMKSPTLNTLPRILKLRVAKSPVLPTIAPIRGVSRSLVNAETTVAKAAPITTPTAMSITLPRRMNFLKPSSISAPPELEWPTLYCRGKGQVKDKTLGGNRARTLQDGQDALWTAVGMGGVLHHMR